MLFKLNKDNLTIKNTDIQNAGSLNYYEADIEFDTSWNNLDIVAVITKKDEQKGISIAVINNKLYIDQEMNGIYTIGFIGYIIENDKKTYQISTNLKNISFQRGAGEIETHEKELPTPSEWEIYIAQIQEMLENYTPSTGGKVDDVLVDGVSVVKNKIANIDLRERVIEILIEYDLLRLDELTAEQIQALNEMVCEINENGELVISYDEEILPINFALEGVNLVVTSNINALFGINTNGELEVSYESN